MPYKDPERQKAYKRNHNRAWMKTERGREIARRARAAYAERHPERIKEFGRDYRRRHKEEKRAEGLRRVRSLGPSRKAWLNSIKMCGCIDCGEQDLDVLGFYHRDMSRRSFPVQALTFRNLENMKREIAKCDVLCANCQRIREYERKSVNPKTKLTEYRRKITEKRQRFAALKEERGCHVCGFSDHRALDFHHKDQTIKRDTVSRMISANAPDEEILAEIARCEVTCSKCHNRIHDRTEILPLAA